MKKKVSYALLAAAVLILGYLNYYKPEKKPEEAPKQIETLNASYESDGYQIKAEKEIDRTDTKETFFQQGEAKVKDLTLKGNDIYLDPDKNLVVKGNILGTLGNGWQIFSEQLNYDKILDMISSNAGVKALSPKGVEITGDTFKSDSKFKLAEIVGNIKAKSEKSEITGDKAEYSDETKILKLLGDVNLKGKEDGKDIVLNLKGANYNVETKILESKEPFTGEYAGAKLSGDYLRYDENTGDFQIKNNPVIETSGYVIKLAEIANKKGSDIIDLIGKIEGSKGNERFTGEKGEYNTSTGLLTIYNFSQKDEKGADLKAERAVYSKNEELINFYGKISDGDYILESSTVEYNPKTGVLQIPNEYTVVTKDGKQKFTGLKGEYNKEEKLFRTPGKVIVETPDNIVEGLNLIYNTENGIGKIETDIIIRSTKDDSIITADTSEFKNGEYLDLLGNLKMEDKDNLMTSGKARYNLKDGKIYIPQILNLKKKDGSMTGTISRAEIEPKTSILKGYNIELKNQDYTVRGTDGTYSIPKETFKINKITAVSQKGDRFQADRSEGSLETGIINFLGNAKASIGEATTITSDTLKYDMKKNKAYGDTSTKTIVKNKESTSVITSDHVEADVKSETAVLKGNVKIDSRNNKGEVTTGRGETGILRGKQKEFELSGNPVIENEKTVLTADKIIYNTNTNKVKATGKVLIEYKKQ